MQSRELQRAVREGDVAAVARVLREHKADASVQCEGLDALDELTPYPGMRLQNAQVQAALDAGAVPVAVAALRAHGARADVQLSACTVLSRLAASYAAEVGASGAIDAVVVGMRQHPTDADLQAEACHFFYGLATVVSFPDNTALYAASKATAQLNARRAGDAGAVAAVVAALSAHGCTVGRDFVNALHDLLNAPENARRALRAGALDACVGVLRALAKTSSCQLVPRAVSHLVLATCKLLQNVTNAAAAASRAGELGAVEAIVGVMRRQFLLFSDANDPEFAFVTFGAAISVLLLLLDGHALNMERAWRAGALPLVQAALDAPRLSVHQDKFTEVSDLLVQRLSGFVADAEAAADAAAAELLAAEVARPAAVQHKKKGSKKKHHTAPPHAAAAAAPEAPRSTCAICLDAQPCVVLLPCRHLPLCAAPACAAALRGPCPICREAVADTLTVYPS